MGNKDPDSGPFGVGSAASSCTKNVTGYFGKVLNGEYGNYGVKGMHANFFDSPGFSDSDACLIEKNKKYIATHFDQSISMFVYIFSSFNPRFNSNVQLVFKQLHDWSMGQIWKNFVVLLGRTKFDYDSIIGRFTQGNIAKTTETQLFIDEVIDKLTQLAEDDKWMKTLADGTQANMTRSDFEQIRFSHLNVDQIRHCNLDSDGRIDIRTSRLCWQYPNFNETDSGFQYKLDYGLFQNIFRMPSFSTSS